MKAKRELNDNETFYFNANEAPENYEFQSALEEKLEKPPLLNQEGKDDCPGEKSKVGIDISFGRLRDNVITYVLQKQTYLLGSLHKPVAWLRRAIGYKASDSSTAMRNGSYEGATVQSQYLD